MVGVLVFSSLRRLLILIYPIFEFGAVLIARR